MGILEEIAKLTQGTPAGQTTNNMTTQTLPAWYQDMMRGVGAQATNAAAQPRPEYGGLQVAGLTPDQLKAMEMVRGGVGAGQPALDAAKGMYGQAGTAAQNASAAVGGPAQAWPDNFKQYMSPYTSQVTDEIARLGTRNLNENLLPAVNQQFIGAGGFGSTRNADIMARTMRDANADILGKQSAALEAGYKTSADIFGSDATRAQNQGVNQANAAISGGQLTNQAGSGLNQLATNQQNMTFGDANALAGAGGLQQATDQKQLDAQYKDFTEARDWDWNQLNNLGTAMKPFQPAPLTTSASSSSPTGENPSMLSWLTSIFGGAQAANTPAPTTPQP